MSGWPRLDAQSAAVDLIGQRFWLRADPAADLLVLEDRPSRSAPDAFDAAPDDVSFVLRLSFCDRAEPAADLLLGAVEPALSVFDDAVAAFEDVVFPTMETSDDERSGERPAPFGGETA